MTHVTCMLTAKKRISSGTLRSVIEPGYLDLFMLHVVFSVFVLENKQLVAIHMNYLGYIENV